MYAYHPKNTLESFPKYKNPDHPKRPGADAMIEIKHWDREGNRLLLVQAPGPGFLRYEWSPSQTLSSPNAPVVTAFPQVSTTYTVLPYFENCPGISDTVHLYV